MACVCYNLKNETFGHIHYAHEYYQTNQSGLAPISCSHWVVLSDKFKLKKRDGVFHFSTFT